MRPFAGKGRLSGHANYLVIARSEGFTLVEVIVVLVILAILAAIAIPALTGYIDKAKWRDVELRAKTQLTAIQTMLTESYAEYGDLSAHLAELEEKYGYAVEDDEFSSDPALFIQFYSPQFVSDYEKLTGDTYSFRDNRDDSPEQFAQIWTNLSGSIRYFYKYVDYTFFSETGVGDQLWVYYFDDIDSAYAIDELTESGGRENFFTDIEAAKAAGFRSGINVYRYNSGTLERLN